MTAIDYHRHTLQLEALSAADRQREILRFAQHIRVFHYATEAESLAPHGGLFSLKSVVRGTETFLFNGQRVRLKAGEALLMPPNVAYGSEIRGTTESFSAFFPHPFCMRLASEARSDPLQPAEPGSFIHLSPLPIAADAQLRSVLRAARAHLEWQSYGRAEELLQQAVQHLLITSDELCRAERRLNLVRESQRRELLTRLQRARAYLHDNLSSPVGLERLAEVSHVSRFHLLRSFRAAFGSTPAQYHAELRLQKAGTLLARQQLTVAEVAHALGYRDHSAFSRAWKRRYGRPPSHSEH